MPFYESVQTSPTLCVIADEGSRVVWSGHRDGRVRAWKMDKCLDHGTPFREALSWQAHRGPVLSIVMTSYGKVLLRFVNHWFLIYLLQYYFTQIF